MMRKILGYVVVAFLLFYAVTNPHTAAGFVHGFVSGVGAFASALAHGGGR